jgi:beta propeller repeat protein
VTDGKIILWEDHQDYLPKIHVFDLQTRQERLLISRDSPQWTPDLDGETVVYTACSCMNAECEVILTPFTYTKGYLCDREIWGTDLASREYGILVQGLRSSNPLISGDWLTWIQSLDEGGQIVGVLNLGDSAEPQTIDVSLSPSGISFRQDGAVIVWLDGQGNQIWAYNLDTQQQTSVIFSPNQIGDPDISGEIVVWADNRNGNMDIFGYNLSTGEEFPICLEAGDQTSPRIDGNRVVWLDGRFNTGEIYGTQLARGTPEP